MRLRACAPIAVVFTMLHILPSAEAHGQRLSGAAQPIPATTEISIPDTLENGGDPGSSFAPADPAPARSRYELPADSASAAWRRRMGPYAIGGAILGGAVGYAIMPKSCDVGDNMFCGYTALAYPFIGLGVGSWAGILAGYLRERR